MEPWSYVKATTQDGRVLHHSIKERIVLNNGMAAV